MTVPQRLAAFAAAVALAFGVGYGLGGAVDPVLEPDEHAPSGTSTTLGHEEHP